MGSSSKTVIGYKYYLGMHLVLCHGPIDSVTRIFADDDKIAWEGTSTGGRITISAENLFGGKDSEGGMSGDVDILMGESTQGQNDYLAEQLGDDCPYYRGVVSAIFRQAYLGMSSYLKTIGFRATRITKTTGGDEIWYSAKAAIGQDMNPAHILYECLTDTNWGMGYSASDVDEDSFTTAADTLYSEGLGISLLWSSETTLEDFINEITRHIDASLYVSPSSGKFVLKLVRDDYVYDDLVLLDESHISKITDFSRPLVGELTNEVTVTYWDADSGEDSSVMMQDIALIATQGSVVSTAVEYDGFTNGTNAVKAATRDLKALSFPIFSCTIYADRTGAQLNIGDAFRMAWPDFGIEDAVMRVTKIGFGGMSTSEVVIYATQDVFAIGDAVITTPPATEWVSPVHDPAPVTVYKAFPAGYFDVYQFGGTSTIDGLSDTSAILAVCCSAPVSDSLHANLWTVGASGSLESRSEIPYSPSAAVSADIGFTDTTISIESGLDLDEAVVGKYIMIDDEIMRLDTVGSSSLTVGRGCLDSVPAEHSAGAVVYFPGDDLGSDNIEYTVSETVSYKLTSVNVTGELDIDDAPSLSQTLDSRILLPYAPQNVKLNGAAYPEYISGSGDLTVTWSHRDRTLQISETLNDTTDGNIGPETGVTYTVGIYQEDGTLIQEYSGLSGTSQVFANALFSSYLLIRVKLKAVRDGYDSWQGHDIPVFVGVQTVTDSAGNIVMDSSGNTVVVPV